MRGDGGERRGAGWWEATWQRLAHLFAGTVARILVNLLSNALKYSAPGTEVTVTLRREGGEVITSVTDRGPGIASEELPRLFARYYRTETGRERGGGIGLGLYITRMLVEAHGGHIWAESTVGVGSTFSFSLPLADQRGREDDGRSGT